MDDATKAIRRRIGEGRAQPVPGDVVSGSSYDRDDARFDFIGRVVSVSYYGFAAVELDSGRRVVVKRDSLTLIQQCHLPLVLWHGDWYVDESDGDVFAEVS